MEARGVPVLFVDETTWHTMEHLKSKKRRDCRVFGYVTDPNGGKPIRIYEFQPDRKAEHITDFLEGYHYIVVTDGYQGYEKVKDIIHCICWAHVRRKFFDVIPKGAISEPCAAKIGYDMCSLIIFAERYMDDQYGPLSPEERVKYRHKLTKPIIDKFFQWCECAKADKKGNAKLQEAINYALNHKQLLMNFLDYGEAQPTSNIVESALRFVATFRKICMHTGNDKSSQLLMMLMTILQTAAINNLNPQVYMEVLLDRLVKLGKDPSKEDLYELLPWSAKMQDTVEHLNLPKRNEAPLTVDDINNAKTRLYSAMKYAYASSKTLQQTPQAEWFDFHWDEDVVTPPHPRPSRPKRANNKDNKSGSKDAAS